MRLQGRERSFRGETERGPRQARRGAARGGSPSPASLSEVGRLLSCSVPGSPSFCTDHCGGVTYCPDPLWMLALVAGPLLAQFHLVFT